MPDGTIKTAQIPERQVAICICTRGKKGKGWYCWH